MSIPASEVINRLCTQISAIANAAELADDASASMDEVYAAIEKCMSVDCRVANMSALYESVLEAAASNRMSSNELRKRREDVASVYFIRRDDGLVKIGYSHNPSARLAQLRQQHQCGMAILAATKGARKREAELHERFAEHRVQGEWFSPSEELMKFISNLVAS